MLSDEIPHKGGRTFGYRISDGSVDVAYLPDHVAHGSPDAALSQLIGGVDLLIHDAQFLEPERALADAYGHSTVGDCLELAERYAARSLIWFHHGPQRADRALREIEAASDAGIPVRMAREGAVLDVAEFATAAVV